MLGLATLGLMPRQVTPVRMCGLVSGQVATGKMLGLVTLGLMLGQVTPGRMCGLAIPGTISRRTVVYLSDPSITSSVFCFRGTYSGRAVPNAIRFPKHTCSRHPDLKWLFSMGPLCVFVDGQDEN